MNERLSALDASFLYLDSPTTHMHISSLAIYEGPTPRADELRHVLASRVHLIPRFRQRVENVPLGQHRPLWVDDDTFDLDAHLRHVALPAPGDETQLKDLTGRLLSVPLDRSRPLWEMWLIDGLERDRFAILAKTHHALWDGITGADLHAVLLDASPEPSESRPEAWRPGSQPTRVRLLLDGIRERTREGVTFAGAVARALTDPSTIVGRARDFAQGASAYTRAAMRPAPASPLNAATGSRRRFEIVRSSLGEFKTIGRTFEATVNDVVLAVVAGAVRRWLIYRDIRPRDLRVMVPVSVRTKAERGVPGNRVVMFIVDLPLTEPDPVIRLRKISASMAKQKASKQAQAEDLITSVAGFAPPQVVAQLTKLQSVGRLFNFLTTNIPGPQFPLYLRGRRLLELFPQAPLAARQALAVAVLSYDGNMGFGILADRDAVPDVGVIAGGITASVDELKEAADVEDVVPASVPSAVPTGAVFP